MSVERKINNMKASMIHLFLFLFLGYAPLILLGQNISMSGGWAKAKITNTESLVMVNGRMSQGVKEDIYARALVLNDGDQRLVIITYDLNCLDVGTSILRERLKNELGINPENVLLLATHNHSAPIQINTDNFAYGEWLANRMFDLVVECIENEQNDLSLTLSNGMGYFVVSVGNAPVDYEIQLFTVSKDDEPQVMFFTHGVHPQQAAFNKIEAGHPGYAMDIVEARFPGVLAMYADASGGNQFVMPRTEYRREMMNAMKVSIDSLDNLMEKRARKIGGQLADAVTTIHNQHPKTHIEGAISSSMEVLSLPLAPARIGPLPIVAMQGEICAPIGARIKDRFRRDMPIMVMGYMGEHNLYIPTRELVRQNAYQAQTLQIQYASPVGWDPSVEDEMVNGVIEMVERQIGKK